MLLQRLSRSLPTFLILISGLASSLTAADRCFYEPNRFEDGVLDQLNLARKDPPGYAFHLEDLEDTFRGKDRKVGGNTYVTTQEGISALEEAIHVLQETPPRSTLDWDPCLAASAAAHVKDTGPAGLVGHDGCKGEHFPHRVKRYLKHYREVGENISYGSTTAEDVVQQLLIDDGVPDRGHRHNIYEPHFNSAGVACGPHTKYGTMCVIDFARE